MAHLDYDDNNITHAPGRTASLKELSQHGNRMPITCRTSVLLGNMWRLGHRDCARLSRLPKFLLVGVTGVLVNSFALLILFQWARLPLVAASALATELAIINNFCWNDHWTFKRTRLSLRRFAKFNLVSLAGLVITVCSLWVLVNHLGLHYLAANLLGITLATAWNFAANTFWTWGGAR
jgi:putative flippase GtrA